MADNLAQREREDEEISSDASRRLFIVLQADAAAAAHSLDTGQTLDSNDWARKVPDGLLIAAAVVGACIGCPIGAAAGGMVVGFACGFVGALLGELTVLAAAKLLKVVLPLAAVGVLLLVLYALVHAVKW